MVMLNFEMIEKYFYNLTMIHINSSGTLILNLIFHPSLFSISPVVAAISFSVNLRIIFINL
jgi:hypothetical protein